MTYAKILAPITGGPGDSVALATAFAAAKPFHAHVATLFVHPDPRDVLPYVYSGVGVSPDLIESIVREQRMLVSGAQSAARSSLMATAKDAGATLIPTALKSDRLTCSFEARFGFVPQLIHEAARYSDLAVFKPVPAGEQPEFANAILETLIKTGRPVLLSTQTPPSSFAQRIAIAWDGRDCAARAATAALPYLKQALSVEILTVQPDSRASIAGVSALREYLSLHGVEASQCNVDQEHKSVGSRLLDAAAGTGADLLVMGGYGHSRLLETLLGGVTMEIVSSHALPVFLVH